MLFTCFWFRVEKKTLFFAEGAQIATPTLFLFSGRGEEHSPPPPSPLVGTPPCKRNGGGRFNVRAPFLSSRKKGRLQAHVAKTPWIAFRSLFGWLANISGRQKTARLASFANKKFYGSADGRVGPNVPRRGPVKLLDLIRSRYQTCAEMLSALRTQT